MNIERLINAQSVFSVYFASDEKDVTLLTAQAAEVFTDGLAGISPRELRKGESVKITITHEPSESIGAWFNQLKELAASEQISVAIYPDREQPPDFKFAIMDMDSTLINQEVIEELAEFVGMREHVQKVTTEAMEGRLNFEEALRERVKLLAGQPASILEEVLEKKISPTPGLDEMLAGFQERGIKTMVVSGGFLEIVGKFAERRGIDYALANRLEVEEGMLTGEVAGPIVTADVKREQLLEKCAQLGCSPEEAIAIGDGANDLKMIQEAGLGVAFCAKPIVREQAFAAIFRRRLDDVLYFLEI